MEDFKIMAKLLAAIHGSEDKPQFRETFVDASALGTTERKRDLLACKLQSDGYIDGLMTADDIDNAPKSKVLWNYSQPIVTIKGLEYIQNSKPLQKAFREIASAGKELAIEGMIEGATSFL